MEMHTARERLSPPPAQKQGAGSQTLGGDRQVLSGGLAVLPGLEVISDLLAFAQGMNAGAFNGGDMHECILGAVVGLNEAETLVRVEPFYGTSSHCRFPRSMGEANAPRTMRGAAF